MMARTKDDKTRPDSEPSSENGRFVYGPRPVGALVPAITRPAFRRRAPATAQLLADWPMIVGPALAAVTTPRRLSGQALAIACPGPVALELQHLAPLLIERINTHLGRRVVDRLRFVQDAPPPAADPVPPPSPAAVEAAESAVGDLPPGGLRDALAALGRVVLRR
jgi:hypothetical protein